MRREQSLVGGDDMLAVGDGFHYQLACDPIATNQLDDDINVRVINDLKRITDHLHLWPTDRLCARCVEIRDHRDFNRPASAPADFFLVALQYRECSGTHGAYAHQADFDWFHLQCF